MISNREGYTEDLLKLRDRYRECFSKYPDVLQHILMDMGVYEAIPATPEKVALRNYGVRILDIIGANDESLIQDVIRWQLNLPFAHNEMPKQEEFI